MNRTLEMKVNLNVLEHLGMNLYSNVPAVLSEIVANSWDADATKVEICIDTKTKSIQIQDNGTGMSRDDVIDRFLMIGFQRRKKPHVSKFGRNPMGRKGIGKLSSFSIANKITVYTKSEVNRTAFCMDARKIKEESKSDSVDIYQPSELNWDGFSPTIQDTGTIVRLTDLKIGVTQNTIEGMRQRLARRFTVTGAKFNFEVSVNKNQINASDRGYHKNIEFVWIYGNIGEEDGLLLETAKKELRGYRPKKEADKISIKGWIGTVRNSGLLKAESGENLNRIAIYMRGKLAQEDILREYSAKEIYADYIVGELYCDDLDSDDHEDIATSSRQSLKFDDSRVKALVDFVGDELKHIRQSWSKLRGSAGMIEARKIPAVEHWFKSLGEDTKSKAMRWVGRINFVRSVNRRQKMELLKASILAFEIYRRKDELSVLEDIGDQSIEQVLKIFKNVDDLQLSYYGQIVSLRLEIIENLINFLNDDAKEKEIQEFLFQNLWLLDPSWERVKGTEIMESGISKWLRESSAHLSEEERKARIDIGYRRASGQHVVIELKRRSASINLGQLINQIGVYRDGVLKKVEEMDQTYALWPVEIICVVGKRPIEWQRRNGPETVKDTLKVYGARLIFYDEILTNAKNSYGDYLKSHENVDPLWKIFKEIDDFTIEDNE